MSDGVGQVCPGSIHGERGAIPCVCEGIRGLVDAARKEGWEAACTKVSDSIGLSTMAADGDAVVRVRRVVSEVYRAYSDKHREDK